MSYCAYLQHPQLWDNPTVKGNTLSRINVDF